jgi:Tfp pilus assembly protein PilP
MAPKKTTRTKQFITIAVVLSAVQVIFILFMETTDTKPKDVKVAISNAVNTEPGIPLENKTRVKIQLSLADYRRINKKYPTSLKQLVPKYFDNVPLDPQTGAAFSYALKGISYKLGEDKPQQSAVAALLKTGDQPSTEAMTLGEEAHFLAMVDAKPSEYFYDPANKRDPFRSFDFAPRSIVKPGGSELECCDYKDLKVVAVLDFGEPKASIEIPSGKGVLAKVGDVVGMYGGKIVKIDKTKITILETVQSFTGKKETRTVEMFLR